MKTSINYPWGDTIDTIKHSKSLHEWYIDRPMLSYNYFKLPDFYSFNINEMRHEINCIIQKFDTYAIKRNSTGKTYNRYKGLGFFAREHSTTPLEDHFLRRDVNHGVVYPDDLHLNNKLPMLYEHDFTNPTKIYNQYFKNIFSVFKSKISKASILSLKSKGYLGSHVDYPYYKCIRLHASIEGTENAYYEVNGEKFQIPADGNWYFIDTGKFHSVWNEGPNDRLTLNINLFVSDDPLILANQKLL